MPSTGETIIDEYLRPELRELLSQCTSKQQAFFKRMYPGGAEKISIEKIPHAMWQCKNTIRKNKESRNEQDSS